MIIKGKWFIRVNRSWEEKGANVSFAGKILEDYDTYFIAAITSHLHQPKARMVVLTVSSIQELTTQTTYWFFEEKEWKKMLILMQVNVPD